MEKAIKRFCDEKENGLFLLDMPTGFGKTYNTLQYIFNNYKNIKGKIIFLTTLKKNLPYDKELKELFEKNNLGKEFEKDTLKIDATYDSVISNFSKVRNSIPKKIKDTEEYKNLSKAIEDIEKYQDEDKRDATINQIISRIKEDIRLNFEKAFRSLIKKELKEFNTATEKLLKIKSNKDYKWIGELYPAVFTKDKKIIFMSMDKFLWGNDTIIEPFYNFYDNDIINNATIFIDEFDATKNTMLDVIITKRLKNRVDYINIISQIYSVFQTKGLPADLLITPNTLEINRKPIIEKIQDVVEDTYDKFNLKYSFKSSSEVETKERNFIFNDLLYYSIFSGNNNYIDLRADDKEKLNRLNFCKEKPEETETDIISMLREMKGCLTYFQRGCKLIAKNYTEHVNQRRRIKDIFSEEFTLDQGVNSVLTEFHFSAEEKKYLFEAIMSENDYKKKKDKNKYNFSNYDLSVYNKGFRYFNFIDSPNHNLRTLISTMDYYDSPEKILIKVTERAKVIGISATATLETVTGNYDINYIKKILGNDYYIIPQEDKDRIRENFKKFNKGYEGIDINVDFVKAGDIDLDLMELFCNDEVMSLKYSEILNRIYKGENSCFYKKRLIRVLKVFKEFIKNENLSSFLCLTNPLPKNNNNFFSIDLIIKIGNIIIQSLGKNIKAEDIIRTIDGFDFDYKKNEIIKELSEGKKIFLISSYYTIGAGQNLQYSVPENFKTVSINEEIREDNEKDFDGIYLEMPRNVIINRNGISTESDLVKYIFQMEFLRAQGEITRYELINLIKSAFIIFDNPKNNGEWLKNIENPYDTRSIKNHVVRTIIQAIGRICRTNQKNNTIHIYVDEEIESKWDYTPPEDMLLNYEFRTLCKKITNDENFSKKGIEEKIIKEFEEKAAEISVACNNKLKDYGRGWTDSKIEEWKELREICLKYPTISQEEMDSNGKISPLYIEAPRKINSYYYSTENDYEKVTVKFEDTLKQKMSAEKARLEILMKIPGLKKYFEEKGYATYFKKNKYLLPPVLFNNVYKGALGEVAGKYILEKYLKIELEEINENEFYEKFDFRTKNGVYIDFKHWNQINNNDAKPQIEEIKKKMNICGCSKVLIINILGDNNKITPRDCNTDDKFAEIVEVPCLFNTEKMEIDLDVIYRIRKEFLIYE